MLGDLSSDLQDLCKRLGTAAGMRDPSAERQRQKKGSLSWEPRFFEWVCLETSVPGKSECTVHCIKTEPHQVAQANP